VNSLPPEVLAPIKLVFFQECEELLGELEAGLLALKQGERDVEIINTVFRAVHSIKGGAASFGLTSLIKFSHLFEAVLADVRSGQLALETDLLNTMLRATDLLADLVRAERDGGSTDGIDTREIEAALARNVAAENREPPMPQEFTDIEFTPKPAFAEPPKDRDWIVRFRPHADLYAKANEPLLLLRDLQRLGAGNVTLDETNIPLLDELNPEGAYLAWTVALHTPVDEQAIRYVFEFVEGDCDLDVALQPDEAVVAAERAALAPLHTGRRSNDGKAPPSSAFKNPIQTIRVDLDRVEKLVNLVSELVITQAMLTQRLSAHRAVEAAGEELPLDEMAHLTREIQDGVMAIRAQSVGFVFKRLSRLVREIETATGKQVNLVTQGEDTEVDRTVIERLSDPLTHMIRNAIDHGIETPAERLEAGKQAQGTVRVSAVHRGGRIVIEIADDGRGIDRSRVRAIAVERGIVSADAELSDQDIDHLIFAPGFSTAATVSEISGRGVGLDVVKRGIQALGGRIAVTSERGKGSTFTLSLPLTLAVLDGMLISAGGESLIVPLTALIETIRPRPEDVHPVGAAALFLRFRGQPVPLIDLGQALGYRPQPLLPEKGVALLVEDDIGVCAGLLVDEILGQRQVVIKSLQANYRAVPGIAAATIMGDGRVALIIDVNAIIAAQRNKPSTFERRAG
jgi:two-component system, chemotaxis family, sensor kinase CheA